MHCDKKSFSVKTRSNTKHMILDSPQRIARIVSEPRQTFLIFNLDGWTNIVFKIVRRRQRLFGSLATRCSREWRKK